MQTSQDARKAKLYGKIGKLIVQAVKAGGTDVVGNTRLKEVLRQAQQASIPKDIIERNIKRASDKSQADFQEVNTPEAPHLHDRIWCLSCEAYAQFHFAPSWL